MNGQLDTTVPNRTIEYTQQLIVHNWTTEYSQQRYMSGQLNTVNSHTQLDNWEQSTTEYYLQPYTAGQLNTVINCAQLDNWLQSTTVQNWTT